MLPCRWLRAAGGRAGSIRLCVGCICVATGAAISGCERKVDGEREAAAVLVDSIAALPSTRRYASEHVAVAQAALARGDSLLARKDVRVAREAYAEATVFARMAVVEAETAERRDSTGAAASIEVSKESR